MYVRDYDTVMMRLMSGVELLLLLSLRLAAAVAPPPAVIPTDFCDPHAVAGVVVWRAKERGTLVTSIATSSQTM